MISLIGLFWDWVNKVVSKKYPKKTHWLHVVLLICFIFVIPIILLNLIEEKIIIGYDESGEATTLGFYIMISLWLLLVWFSYQVYKYKKLFYGLVSRLAKEEYKKYILEQIEEVNKNKNYRLEEKNIENIFNFEEINLM